MTTTSGGYVSPFGQLTEAGPKKRGKPVKATLAQRLRGNTRQRIDLCYDAAELNAELDEVWDKKPIGLKRGTTR